MAHLRPLLVAAALQAALAQPPSTCSGKVNTLPVWAGQPTLVNQTANGLKFIAQPDGNYSAPLIVVHLYGSDYEMGLAYGTLLRSEISTLVPQAMLYMEQQLNASLDWIAEPYRDIVAVYGLEWALNLTYEATKPYAPAYWYDQLQGVADGSGLPYMSLARMTMIPEFIKAQCSIVGAWGAATGGSSSSGSGGGVSGTPGSLLQLRALDWDTDGPFQQFPVLATWHPSGGSSTSGSSRAAAPGAQHLPSFSTGASTGSAPPGGWAHTTMGWAGLLGAITGFSSSGVAISEKVWDAYTGAMSVSGYPFHFLLQDILRFDSDTESALSRIATANRTCAIWIGIGDNGQPLVTPAAQKPKEKVQPVAVAPAGPVSAIPPVGPSAPQFRLVSYSNQLVQVWSPRNWVPYPNHDSFPDLLFINKHVQPSGEPCMNDLFHWLWGNLTAQDLYTYVTALEQTGDMHIAVYDFASSLMYVSNASPGDAQGNGVVNAYDRPFLRFNMTELWTLPPPQ